MIDYLIFSIILFSFECYCSNIYGMDGKTVDDRCNCVCTGTSDHFCGCNEFYKVFGLRSIFCHQKNIF